MGLLDEAIKEHLDLKRRRGADPSEVDRLEREALGPVRRAPQDAPDALMDEESPVTDDYAVEEEAPYELDQMPEWSDPRSAPAPFEHGVDPRADTARADQWNDAEPATEITPYAETADEPDLPEPGYDPPRHHEIAEEWEAHERQGLAGETVAFEPDEPAPVPPAPAGPQGEPSYPPPARDSSGPVFGGERQRPAAPEEEYDYDQETLEHDVEAEELGHPREPEGSEGSAGEDVLEETPDFLQDTPDHDRLWFEQRPPRDFDFDE